MHKRKRASVYAVLKNNANLFFDESATISQSIALVQ